LATEYNGLARTYQLLYEKPEAVENYAKALKLATEIGDRTLVARALNNLASTYTSVGERTPADYARATSLLRQALTDWRAIGDRSNEAATLVNLGQVAVATHQYQLALRSLEPALHLARSAGNRAAELAALKYVGDAYAGRRMWKAAFERYDTALPLATEYGFAGSDAAVLLAMARAERGRGDLDAARTRTEAAIAKIEALRSRVVSQDYRASFFAEARVYYDFYIDLLMQMHRREPTKGYDRRALEASERAPARSLLEMLAESNALVPRDVDPKLAARIATLRDTIDAKASVMIQATGGDRATSAELHQDIERLTSEYESAVAEARSQSARYTELAEPETLTCDRIQTEVLDRDTALVEYWLGDTSSYAWVVTTDAVRGVSLPKRALVEQATRRLYDAISTAPAWTTRQLELASAADSSPTRRATETRLAQGYLAAARPLSRMLLDPIWSDLGARRLLVVADGALHYLPFGSLPIGAPDTSGEKPLVADREVVNAPSASIVPVLRHDESERARPTKQIAMFADPVFDPSDERVSRAGNSGAKENAGSAPDSARDLELATVAHAASDTGALGPSRTIPRLASTRQEADAVRALVPGDSSMFAVDFAASRETAMSSGLASYRVVHFATHGLLDARHPELSGLLLSLCNEDGSPKSGFLSTAEVFGLKLNADLVVLSACQTGLGKEVRGEGLVGLTRAFMYAGSPRVVVSLWSVSDRATASLMSEFYRAMLVRGQTPAAALRSAQIATWQHDGWRAPYYWAPFVLQGEWR
jgi:CHAT domain-containing protein